MTYNIEGVHVVGTTQHELPVERNPYSELYDGNWIGFWIVGNNNQDWVCRNKENRNCETIQKQISKFERIPKESGFSNSLIMNVKN